MMKSSSFFHLFLLSLTLLSACASAPQTKAVLRDSGSLPRAHTISNVPFIAQSENHCGPATLAMVAQHAGVKASLETLGSMMFTPGKKGTLQSDYLSAARRLGLIAVPVFSLKNLLVEVSQDHPVVVLENLGSSANPIWHYAVLHGYDLSSEELIFHSGADQNFRLELSQFERVWKGAEDWAVVILAPGKLPSTSTLSENLAAANALERTNQYREANLGYQSISEKWPESVGALFGLGNTFAALKNDHASIITFEKALKLAPDSSAIQNNLREVRSRYKKNKK